jgi:hypothetical protein
VRFVVFSASDRPSAGYDPELTLWLRKIYQNDLVTVFEVDR